MFARGQLPAKSDCPAGLAANSDATADYPVADLYEVGEVLGTGFFGKVHLARSRRNGDSCVLKVVERKKARSEDELCREVTVQMSLSHPYVVTLLESFIDEERLYIVMEHCRGGELYEALRAQGRFNEEEAKVTFGQIAEAVNYMHSKGLAHRDLKLENFLLSEPVSSVPLARNTVKLIDFGFASRFAPGMPSMNTKCGSEGFIAPEVLMTSAYDEKCDVFSCGVILYCMLCGRFPFKDLYETVHVPLHFTREQRAAVPPQARRLLEAACCKCPRGRPSMPQVSDSPWLRTRGGARSGALEILSASGRAERLIDNVWALGNMRLPWKPLLDGLAHSVRVKTARGGLAARPQRLSAHPQPEKRTCADKDAGSATPMRRRCPSSLPQ